MARFDFLHNTETLTLNLSVNGHTFEAKLADHEADALRGEWRIMRRDTNHVEGILHSDTQSRPFHAALFADPASGRQRIQLWLDGQTRWLERQLPQTQRASAQGGAASVAGDIKAPMPGTVLKVLVAVGDVLAANAPVVIMESMKMEMTLSATGACRVKKINVAAGQMPEMGAVLVEMEAVEASAEKPSDTK